MTTKSGGGGGGGGGEWGQLWKKRLHREKPKWVRPRREKIPFGAGKRKEKKTGNRKNLARKLLFLKDLPIHDTKTGADKSKGRNKGNQQGGEGDWNTRHKKVGKINHGHPG